MPTGVSLQAHLVIDNCVLVMLHEYFCDRYAAQLRVRLIPAVRQWMAEQIEVLRQFTPDGRVYCTDCVAREFRPGAGRLSRISGIEPHECQTLATQICDLLHQTHVARDQILPLRNLPAAPRRLVGTSGLSDNDLSLVVLALDLTLSGNPVYILTNDQDLLQFVTWLRTRPEVRGQWPHAPLLQGLQSLTYLELVHRACRIETEQMQDLVRFFLVEHYSRTELAGTSKGTSILLQVMDVQESLTKSVRIKTLAIGGAPA